MNLTVEPSELSSKLKALDKQVHLTDEPLPKDNHFLWIVSGAKGTGKSSLVLNMLKSHLRKTFNNIYLISPTAKRDPKFSKLVEELDEQGKFYDSCNEKNLLEIVDKISNYNSQKKSPKNLLIIDDCATELKSSTSKSTLNKIAITMRHLKTSMVFMTQKYNKINPLIRTNADLLSIFRTQNKKELNTIIDDLPVKPEEFQAVYEYATTPDEQNTNPFLHISLFNARTRYFKNFDRIYID